MVNYPKLEPPTALQLTEEEKSVSVDRILKATNPNLRSIPVMFSYRKEDRSYKFVPTMDQTAYHFSEDGNAIRKDSEEAKKQAEDRERRIRDLEMAEQAEKSPDSAHHGISTKALKNQFNFCDRASQTYNNAMRERGIMTEPPPIITFSSTATQWEIHDAYVEDLKNQQAQQQKAKPGVKKEDEKKKETIQATEASEDILTSPQLLHSLKIMERMVVGNNYFEVQDDYKYWEDAADQYKEDGGTLLPLWKFTSDKVKKKTVTALCWHPTYTDMFAVGYGSYDFLKQGSGVIHCFSLKNPSYPEYTFTTESGVMCLDFHKQHTSLLACGLYDGTVQVYDVRQSNPKPIYQSNAKTGKHTDPVWQVYWDNGNTPKNLNFYSISSDGRVTNWMLAKSELQYSDVMELKLTDDSQAESVDPETALAGLSGGCCFDFSQYNDSVFVVGMEEGKIRKCSKAYNSQYLETYEGHHMSVYSIQWNKFHPDAFLTASADWTVKIWEQNTKKALMSFDLGSPVGEASWAPYSSTVFAAVTTDGKVHVYDLNENKHEPMCDQLVVKKAKLTRIAFNPRNPILLVGDDRGTVLSLKLSPNLRRKAKIEEGKTRQQTEVEKLDRLIAITNKDRQLMQG